MTNFILRENDNEILLSQEDLPIKIGTDLNSEIVVIGPLSIGIALIIDLIDDRLVLQKINSGIDTTINNNEFSGNHWIKDGDELIVSDKRVRFKISTNQIELNIDNVSLEAQPTQFQKRQSESIFQNKTVQRIAIGIVFLVGYFLFYLFTSKAVEINTMPADAKVSVSGGFFPHLKISGRFLLRPGEYRADYSRSGYFPDSLDIEINDESSQVIDIKLKKLPGIITFTTRPDVDYELYLEGKRSTPFLCEDIEMSLEECTKKLFTLGGLLEPGTRDVELRFEKYFPIQEEISVEGMNQEQEFIFDLEPAWADVQIDTKPSGAEIFIDNKNIGMTPLDFDLIEGQHVLGIKKNGYKDFSTEIAVKARENIVLEPFNLNRLDSKLSVVSYPKGASVNIDAVYRGMTPVEIDLEPLVAHTVSVSKPGYKTMDQIIELKTVETLRSMAKDSEVINLDLQPIFGTILIQGTQDAEVIQGEKSLGNIPLKVNLIAKEQILTIKKDGLLTQDINVKPTPGFNQTLKIKLLTSEEAVLAAMPQSIKTSQGHQMRLISTGQFIVGTPRRTQGRQSNETERLVEITRPFYVGTREITNNEFRKFKPKHTSGAETYRELSNGLHPTVMVTWEDAVGFCNWLSKRESLDPAYRLVDGLHQLIQPMTNGYRLLTEVEWEWVARYNGGGGAQKYPWGASMPPIEDSGNFADESAESLMTNVLTDYWDGYPISSPVAKFEPNKLGLYDLGGNVSEWVNDYYAVVNRDLDQLDKDPYGPDDGTVRVIRGSSWRHSTITALRYAYRDYGTQGRLDVGFRIARYTDNE